MNDLEKLFDSYVSADITNVEEILKTKKGDSFPRFNPNPIGKDKGLYKAVIRFLPNLSKAGKDINNHSLEEFSYWLESDNEKVGVQSPVMVGKECIIADTWRKYNKKEDAISKAIKEKLKRNTNYYSLIYVVEDFTTPENTGKIMVFKYGTKIRAKIEQKINPSEEDKKMGQMPLLPWDLMDGANFRISAKIAAGWANYDDCTFLEKSPIALSLSSKDNLRTSPEVKTKLLAMLQEAPKIDELFSFKEWTSDQTEKVKRILNYITGNTSTSNTASSKINAPETFEDDEEESGDDSEMDDFLSKL